MALGRDGFDAIQSPDPAFFDALDDGRINAFFVEKDAWIPLSYVEAYQTKHLKSSQITILKNDPTLDHTLPIAHPEKTAKAVLKDLT